MIYKEQVVRNAFFRKSEISNNQKHSISRHKNQFSHSFKASVFTDEITLKRKQMFFEYFYSAVQFIKAEILRRKGYEHVAVENAETIFVLRIVIK